MKERLIATGDISQVDVVAKQLHRQSTTDTTLEKPVTKKMLKEQYLWDELLGRTCT